MALILEHEVSEQVDCTKWDFIITSGDYNATTNPGGFGAPNVASTAITSATLEVKPYGYTTGWLFTFTIVSGSVTACTVTSPDGTVTNIFADLEYTSFPFSEAEPFVINNEWFGGEADSELTSSAYYFELNISDGTDTYTSSSDELIVCSICCCVRNSAADLDARDCGCGDSKIEKAARARIFLDAAIYAMENGEVDQSYANLMKAKDYCEGKCTNC